ncbi:MAG: hypothetical protein AAFQ89_06615 [Cyanobacteria bacterium J06626_18]
MSSNPLLRSRHSPRQALDQVALSLMAGLVVVAVLLVVSGDHATARVQEFSWQERTVGAENGAFILSFSRPMDTASVEANLAITPLIPGRISWAGRRMAYTLDVPVPYGETFEVGLPDAQDRFSGEDADTRFEAFNGTFRSRDRAMAYIGTQGEEKDRLVLVNFTREEQTLILTPSDLKVLNFEPYPLGDCLLFSAVEADAPAASNLAPALYAVATGLLANPPEALQGQENEPLMVTAEAGTLTPILGSDTYQNLAFDLSPDGRTIVVQRVNQSDPADFGPWILREDEDPRPLQTEPGGEFLIAPDNQTLLMLQGQGTAVIPLAAASEESEDAIAANQPLDFLPEFGRVFDISSDGSAAAMVDFNQNDPERRFTESLVVVTNQGEEQELLNVTGAILSAQFSPTNQTVYVLASEVLPGEAYQEQPFLEAINLQTQESLRLLSFPPMSRVSVSVSPDGLDALIEVSAPEGADSTAFSVQTLVLSLFNTPQESSAGIFAAPQLPELLPHTGLSPTWLP